MPSFDITYDFEVYCNTCGAGLCNQSDTTYGYTRNAPQVRVDVCDSCMQEKEKEIEELKEKIIELENQLV